MLLLSCKNRFYWIGVGNRMIGLNQFDQMITYLQQATDNNETLIFG